MTRGSRCTSWCVSTWVGAEPTRSTKRVCWRSISPGTSPASTPSSSRWSPRLNFGHRAASAAASSHAGRSTIRLVLVRMPPRCDSMMPRLIPGLIPKSSPVTMSHFMELSFCERRLELFQPAPVIHELLDRPRGAVLQDSHRVKQDAVGATSALRSVEEQIQLPDSRKTAAGALRRGAVALEQPRPLFLSGAIQEGREVVGEGAGADVVPVDEAGALGAVRPGHEHVLGPEVAVQERLRARLFHCPDAARGILAQEVQ